MSFLKLPTIYTSREIKTLSSKFNKLNSAFNAKVSECVELKLQNSTLMQENTAMKEKILELQRMNDAKEIALGKKDELIRSLKNRHSKLQAEHIALQKDILRHITDYKENTHEDENL